MSRRASARRSLRGLAVVACLAVPFGAASCRHGATASERFFVIGDMGTGGPGQRQVARVMAESAGERPIAFLLTVGDNFYPAGVTGPDDPQWTTKFEEVYADPRLRVPVFPTLGNHDHLGRAAAQVEYAATHPRWRLPAAYHAFTRTLGDGTRVAFFALDTDPIASRRSPGPGEPPSETAGGAGRPREAWEEQVAWLDRELAASEARWKIVFGHHPLHGHEPRRGDNQAMIARLEPILARHGVDLYLAGHDHVLDVMRPVQGVHHVTCGGGGGDDNPYRIEVTDESSFAATGGGFCAIEVSRGAIVVEIVDDDGVVRHVQALTKR